MNAARNMRGRIPGGVTTGTSWRMALSSVLMAWGFVIATGGAAGGGPSPVPPASGPLDLQTCFELAVLRSETLGMKEEDIRVVEARYWQAVAGILPKVRMIASESLQDRAGGGGSSSSSSSTGSSASGSAGSSESFGNRTDRFSSRLNVRQPIFSGFRDQAVASAVKAEMEARKQTRERSLQLLYLDVADVFYQILLYQRDLDLLAEVQEAIEQRIAELEKRVRLGRSRSGELLAAKFDLAEARVTVEQARGLLGASRELMSFLTGASASVLTLKDAQALPSSESLEAYLSQTGERPDVLAAIQSEKAAVKQLSAAKGEHWPGISAEGNYTLAESPSSQRDWNILLTVDIPLFEGGLIEARVRERRSLVKSSRLNLDLVRRTADKDVRTAYNNFVAAAAQMARLDEAVRIAGENHETQARDYKLGIVSNLEVLQALRQKHETRRRLLGAEMETRVNLIRLHVAAGRMDGADETKRTGDDGRASPAKR